jgi:hypothetical protein
MKKTTAIFLVLLGLLATPKFTLAAAPERCQVKGTIQESSFVPAVTPGCLKSGTCSKDMPKLDPDGFLLKVKVIWAGEITADNKTSACSKYFGRGWIIDVFMEKTKVKSGDNLNKGTEIEGVINSVGRSTYETYKLSGSQVEQGSTNSDQKPTDTQSATKTSVSWWQSLINKIQSLFNK